MKKEIYKNKEPGNGSKMDTKKTKKNHIISLNKIINITDRNAVYTHYVDE